MAPDSKIFGDAPFLTVVYAKKASGKTELTRWVAFQYRHVFSRITVISASAESTGSYEWCNPDCVHTGYDPQIIRDVLERQTRHKKAGKTVHELVVLDDIVGTLPTNLSKFPELQQLATQNRHTNTSLIICSQHPRSISNLWRTNLDRACILKSLRPAYEMLAADYSNFPRKSDFVQFCEENTRDYSVVMFNAREQDPDKYYTVFRVPQEFMSYKFKLGYRA